MKWSSLVLAWLFVSLAVDRSLACSGPGKTMEQNIADASEIFVARVVKTEETALRDSRFPEPVTVIEGTYRLIEPLKGSPPASGIVRDAPPGFGNCGLGLLAGLNYVFFIHDDERFVLSPGGSFGAIHFDRGESKKRLDDIVVKIKTLR